MKFLQFLGVFLSLSACNNQSVEKTWCSLHPIWNFLNENEHNIAQNEGVITKFGLRKIRFNPKSGQTKDRCYTRNSTNCKIDGNYVELEGDYLFITPTKYGIVDQSYFGRTMQAGIKYKFNTNDNGLPKEFLEDFIEVGGKDKARDSLFIISKGVDGFLGISNALQKAFEEKKSQKEILDYCFLCSVEAIKLYNQKVKKGEDVFLFIHTAG